VALDTKGADKMKGQIKTGNSEYVSMTYEMVKSWGGSETTGFAIAVTGEDEALRLLANVFSEVNATFDDRPGSVWFGTTTAEYKFQFLKSDNLENY
jgi:6-phosphogluconate dehydrogenase